MIPEQFKNQLNAFRVDPETIDQLSKFAEIIEVSNRSTLAIPGDYSNDVYYIIKGGFVCRYFDENLYMGKTVYFYLADVHHIMACLDSYFKGTKTSYELRAIMDSTVVRLRKEDLDKLLESDLNLFKLYNHILVNGFLEENLFLSKLISYTKEEFYNDLMNDYPEIIRDVPAKYIAEFMGISPEWLVKLKKRIRQY